MSLQILSNRYRVLNILGDGGFGKTFLVEDMQMPSNRRCVLKQLKPVHDATPELRQLVQARFQREAAIIEMLGEVHAQVPCLYAYFSEAEQFYLVQEWVDGITIAQKVQREGMQREQAVKEMIGNLLGAIAFIHSKGIVHRDIKPDNIILRSRDNKPVLIDFGAVKETMNTVVNSQTYSTRSIVVGTPGYMPTEQLSGRPVYASDIYSLGMTAIYMLTGKIPQEVLSDPASGKLLWRDYAADISSDFAAFLDKAVHTNAQSRFSTAQSMLAALQLLFSNVSQAEIGQIEISKTEISQLPRHSSHDVERTQKPQMNNRAAALSVSAFENMLVVAPGNTLEADSPFTPADNKRDSSAKSALIVGSLVGISILVGVVIVGRFLPKSEKPQIVIETPESPSSEASFPAVEPVEPLVPQSLWKFMGTASSGESISVDTSSLRSAGDTVDFEYKIDDERVVATANCAENRWYAEKYGWYSPQSEATQLMLNFVCQ